MADSRADVEPWPKIVAEECSLGLAEPLPSSLSACPFFRQRVIVDQRQQRRTPKNLFNNLPRFSGEVSFAGKRSFAGISFHEIIDSSAARESIRRPLESQDRFDLGRGGQRGGEGK